MVSSNSSNMETHTLLIRTCILKVWIVTIFRAKNNSNPLAVAQIKTIIQATSKALLTLYWCWMKTSRINRAREIRIYFFKISEFRVKGSKVGILHLLMVLRMHQTENNLRLCLTISIMICTNLDKVRFIKKVGATIRNFKEFSVSVNIWTKKYPKITSVDTATTRAIKTTRLTSTINLW